MTTQRISEAQLRRMIRQELIREMGDDPSTIAGVSEPASVEDLIAHYKANPAEWSADISDFASCGLSFNLDAKKRLQRKWGGVVIDWATCAKVLNAVSGMKKAKRPSAEERRGFYDPSGTGDFRPDVNQYRADRRSRYEP